jgi:hypothetical protein
MPSMRIDAPSSLCELLAKFDGVEVSPGRAIGYVLIDPTQGKKSRTYATRDFVAHVS